MYVPFVNNVTPAVLQEFMLSLPPTPEFMLILKFKYHVKSDLTPELTNPASQRVKF